MNYDGPFANPTFVFRHVVGWMGEEEHLEAIFDQTRLARDFCSMQENEENRWTVVQVDVFEDLFIMRTAELFHGGRTVDRVNLESIY